jgi:cytochrome oxidase Cu insertion factor (SCO1/SenC/PrrC family)
MTESINQSSAVVRRRRGLLLLVAALFFGPLGLAFYMYYGGVSWVPHHGVQHGHLLSAVRPVPEARLPLPQGGATEPDFLRHRWTLLYGVADHCDDRCVRAVVDLRAIRHALNRNQDRVQVVVLGAADCCTALQALSPKDGSMVVASADGLEAAPVTAALMVDQSPWNAAGRVYLIDPIGNFLMFYEPSFAKKDILTDLEKLLKLSHIG